MKFLFVKVKKKKKNINKVDAKKNGKEVKSW